MEYVWGCEWCVHLAYTPCRHPACSELCPSSCLHFGTQELLGHINDPEVLKAKSCTPLPMHYSKELPKGTLQTQPLA